MEWNSKNSSIADQSIYPSLAFQYFYYFFEKCYHKFGIFRSNSKVFDKLVSVNT